MTNKVRQPLGNQMYPLKPVPRTAIASCYGVSDEQNEELRKEFLEYFKQTLVVVKHSSYSRYSFYYTDRPTPTAERDDMWAFIMKWVHDNVQV